MDRTQILGIAAAGATAAAAWHVCAAPIAATAATAAPSMEPEPEPPAAAAPTSTPVAVATVDDHALFLVGAAAARQGLLDALTESGALEGGLIKGRSAPHVRLAAEGEPLGEDELPLVPCEQPTSGGFDAATYFAELGPAYPQRALLYANVIGSTQTLLEAHPALCFSKGNGLVCTAKTQRAGRGRRTNQWESPPGCLLFSVGWKHADASTVVFMQYLFGLALVVCNHKQSAVACELWIHCQQVACGYRIPSARGRATRSSTCG